MSDFLTEKKKNRNTGETEMGSLWLFYTFFPGSYWRIGEVYP